MNTTGKILLFLFILQAISLHNTFSQRYTNNAPVKNLERYDVNPYHFGFTLGFNKMDFVITRTPDYRNNDTLYVVESKPENGFNIGIVSNLRMGNFFDLRFIPSLYFGERQLLYTYKYHNQIINEKKRVESNILNFPLLIKFKSERMTNTRVYVLGGMAYTLDLASQSKKKTKEDEAIIKLKKNDYLYVVGVGFDFYLSYFKFATELKMEYGINDMLKREDNIYTSGIDKLKSKIFVLSFTFE